MNLTNIPDANIMQTNYGRYIPPEMSYREAVRAETWQIHYNLLFRNCFCSKFLFDDHGSKITQYFCQIGYGI